MGRIKFAEAAEAFPVAVSDHPEEDIRNIAQVLLRVGIRNLEIANSGVPYRVEHGIVIPEIIEVEFL